MALVTKAVAVLTGSDPKVKGTVYFEQPAIGSPVEVKGTIEGLTPNADRGFHVHDFGDLTNGCTTAGPHFNPFGTDHGDRFDPVERRHVGDLGNVTTDSKGVATFRFTDGIISLNGPYSIIGRALVVHSDRDDRGRGGDEGSRKTGNSGERAGCGVIGIAFIPSTTSASCDEC